MEWALKALLTAVAVTVAILTARRCDRAVGGAIAGLPVVSAPWLVCTAARSGAEAATQVATASVAACVVLAAFAAGYAWAARRTGVMGATGAALLAAALAGPLAAAASVRLDTAVALAAVACTLAILTWPAASVGPCAPRRRGSGVPFVAAFAGILGASSGSASALCGPFAASVLNALPVVGYCTVVREHRTSGAAAASQCLHGYLAGLYGKIAFGFAFATLVTRWGTVAATVAAITAGVSTTYVVLRHVAARPVLDPQACRAPRSLEAS